MSECNDCIQATLVEKIDERLSAMEEVSKQREKELGEIRTEARVTKEQTKMVFNILNEIKESIKTIAAKLDNLEGKPGQRWEESTRTLITVIITSVVTYFFASKFIN